jgi:hypothetical protein
LPTEIKIDLRTTDEEGNFPCPTCGALISPDDDTEEVYTIIETFIGLDDNLEKMVVRCNTCKSIITLEGFIALLEETGPQIKISDALPKSKPGFRSEHNISLDNALNGLMVIEYAQKEDVKAFKRIKRLRVGDPFKCTITIENPKQIEPEYLRHLTQFIRRRFKSLTERDIYFIEVKNGRRNILGRASNLIS